MEKDNDDSYVNSAWANPKQLKVVSIHPALQIEN